MRGSAVTQMEYLGINVVEVVDTSVLQVVADEVELKELLGEHADGGEHADTAVLDLSLAPLLDDGLA